MALPPALPPKRTPSLQGSQKPRQEASLHLTASQRLAEHFVMQQQTSPTLRNSLRPSVLWSRLINSLLDLTQPPSHLDRLMRSGRSSQTQEETTRHRNAPKQSPISTTPQEETTRHRN